MNTYLVYGIIFVILLALEVVYFKTADKFNIIDKPNERSSHSTIVLRGGGIIFLLGAWVWCAFFGFLYPWFLLGLTLVAGVSFIDDVRSLPNSLRLAVQFVAMALLFIQLGLFGGFDFSNGLSVSGVIVPTLIVLVALVVGVGASDVINFMDGVNGITGSYTLATLVPALLLNRREGYVEESLLVVAILSVVVFCYFNFRPKEKAKCFAGDVGSLGAAFIMLFVIGLKVMVEMDPTWLVFLVVYGIDGVTTICHRFILGEHLGEAHRKHSYQLMANELKMSPITVSLIYSGLQLAINLGFIYLCPDTVLAHWVYLGSVLVVIGGLNLCFRKKYYHLHEEYLASLKN